MFGVATLKMLLNGPATEALERLTKRRRTTEDADTACSSEVSDNSFSSIKTEEENAATTTGHQSLFQRGTEDQQQLPQDPPLFNFDDLFDAISATETEKEEVFPSIGWRFEDDDDEGEKVPLSHLGMVRVGD